MRLAAVLLGSLVGLSCGEDAKKSDPGDKAANQKSDADGAKPDEAPHKEVAPAPPQVACASIVTSDDIQKACGVATEAEKSRAEGQTPIATCSRKYRGPEGKSVSFQLAVHPDLEKVSSIPWPEDATGIEGLGDAASAYVAVKGDKFDWHTVEVRTGNQVFYLRSINDTGATPLCTTDQLTDLSREAFPRLAKP